jgi:hypothetical protein
MQCPFPGMDPYIERPAIWGDFHDRLITTLCAALQPLLRPRYAALMQDRLYVVESKRPVRPDVSVVDVAADGGNAGTATLVELDQPVVFELVEEDIREPYIEIIEPAAGNRLITAIEVLSPDNKHRGPGRIKYLDKRRELRAAHANIVEIDLLRTGKPTFRIPEEMASEPAWRYMVAVSRWPRRQELYPIALAARLPRIAIPLKPGDRDVPLDLQTAFTRCWQDGAYPELLQYDGPPPGKMNDNELAWCAEQLRRAGLHRDKPGTGA